jgi:hypothetical protein
MLNHQESISSLQLYPLTNPMGRPVNHQEFISIESVGHQVGGGKNMYIDLTLSRVTKVLYRFLM